MLYWTVYEVVCGNIHIVCSALCVCVREREIERESMGLDRNFSMIFLGSVLEQMILLSELIMRWHWW